MTHSEPNCGKHYLNLTCPEFFCELSLFSLLLIPDILIPSLFKWSELLLVGLLFGVCLHCHNMQTQYNGTSASVISFAVSFSQKC